MHIIKKIYWHLWWIVRCLVAWVIFYYTNAFLFVTGSELSADWLGAIFVVLFGRPLAIVSWIILVYLLSYYIRMVLSYTTQKVYVYGIDTLMALVLAFCWLFLMWVVCISVIANVSQLLWSEWWQENGIQQALKLVWIHVWLLLWFGSMAYFGACTIKKK